MDLFTTPYEYEISRRKCVSCDLDYVFENVNDEVYYPYTDIVIKHPGSDISIESLPSDFKSNVTGIIFSKVEEESYDHNYYIVGKVLAQTEIYFYIEAYHDNSGFYCQGDIKLYLDVNFDNLVKMALPAKIRDQDKIQTITTYFNKIRDELQNYISAKDIAHRIIGYLY